jgi:alpha-galactosidase
MPLVELQNTFFQFSCNPDLGKFSLYSSRPGLPSIQNASLRIQIIKDGIKHNIITNSWNPFQLIKTVNDSIHGRLHQVEFSIFIEDLSQVVRLTFSLSENLPIFLWNLVLENQSSTSVIVNLMELISIGESDSDGESRIVRANETTKTNYTFHANGWQSWSHSATYREDQAQKHTRLRYFQDVMVYNPGTPVFRQTAHFSADFFGVLADVNQRAAILFGFLSQKQQFGSLEAALSQKPKIRMWVNGDRTLLLPGKTFPSDWAIIYPFYFDKPDPLAIYYEAVQRENSVDLNKELPVGWCSWYQFYQNINEEKILRNLNTIKSLEKQLPLSLVQIDDGYQKEIGDWYSFSKGFPHGVNGIAAEIKQKGKTPGLWMAPFILHPNSNFALDHPHLLLRKKFGRPVNAGFVWNVFTQALDLSIPESIEVVKELINTAVNQWGFPYLKLDFLYAGALKGIRYDQSLTRAQILRKAMLEIRRSAGEETFLLGCGAPLGSVIGLVDANRISADVSGNWLPKFGGFSAIFKKEPHMPSAKNAIQNILTRAEQHNRWWINDPDCLLVRDEIDLTMPEIQSLATLIAITGGSLIVSDDLPKLSEERRRIIELMLPIIGRRAFVMDWLDTTTPHNIRLDLSNPSGNWTNIARFNWKENAREIFISLPDFCLPPMDYWVYSFWENNVHILEAGNPIHIPSLACHGVALLSLRPVTRENQFIGSNLHISMGLEIKEIINKSDLFSLKLSLPREAKGDIWLNLNRTPLEVLFNNEPAPYEEVQDNIFRFPVAFAGEATLEIKLPHPA